MGFAVDTLHVMSAFRTPFYNRAIGDVEYSAHQWGSAADVYVDPENSESNGGSQSATAGSTFRIRSVSTTKSSACSP